ncbi:hypothetical protein LTR37_000975 [Vermiconidia calcicola]|uniref:Uncharacterized protein n=1 Tax=Vermiconidia calcicola TaxID=1690605 RepID=A0ACC3NWU5_9PEZI|nr:hypothetical protein LTR37_000975 [Vermiconidia calcicola]
MAYKAPDGPPPTYPQQAHYDAGPVDPRSQGYYGSPPPPNQYGSPAPYQQGYGPPPGGPYGPGPQYGGPYQQPPPMGYQQQPPMGYYDQRGGRGAGAGGGICAGIMSGLQTVRVNMVSQHGNEEFAQYPEPLIMPPKSGKHRQSFVILHGRGSNAKAFGPELLQTPIHDSSALVQDVFPDARFIFPTASKRRAQLFNRAIIGQWFDNGSLRKHIEKEEQLQYDGLRESSRYIHKLLEAEIVTVGAQNVLLWGLSQGCAISLISLLLWEGPKIAAVVGMCGWLPLRKRMEDAVYGLEEQFEEDNPFSDDNDPAATIESKYDIAAEYLCEELQLSFHEHSNAPPQIPIFLGHGTEDEKVPLGSGKEAADFCRLMDFVVEYREYEGLGHWYSPSMLADIVAFIWEKTSISASEPRMVEQEASTC